MQTRAPISLCMRARCAQTRLTTPHFPVPGRQTTTTPRSCNSNLNNSEQNTFFPPFEKRSYYLVSGCEATHCSSARALHTRLDWWAVSVGGFIDGYMFTISYLRGRKKSVKHISYNKTAGRADQIIPNGTARDGTGVIPATGPRWCRRSATAWEPGPAPTRASCSAPARHFLWSPDWTTHWSTGRSSPGLPGPELSR